MKERKDGKLRKTRTWWKEGRIVKEDKKERDGRKESE